MTLIADKAPRVIHNVTHWDFTILAACPPHIPAYSPTMVSSPGIRPGYRLIMSGQHGTKLKRIQENFAGR